MHYVNIDEGLYNMGVLVVIISWNVPSAEKKTFSQLTISSSTPGVCRACLVQTLIYQHWGLRIMCPQPVVSSYSMGYAEC